MSKNDNEKPTPETIVVHDEDTGKAIELKGESSDRVQVFADKLYAALRTTRKAGDRLRCKTVNVFDYTGLTISDFERQHCSAHEWTFAGETGGA